ncbi:hypothetical protein BDV93DRAFT_592401 [Ceratobasidium sp. AG-I]|nr:hypothetical protein BDV93DRAFT_592401 [Ceratobasidium sp. AG-I]
MVFTEEIPLTLNRLIRCIGYVERFRNQSTTLIKICLHLKDLYVQGSSGDQRKRLDQIISASESAIQLAAGDKKQCDVETAFRGVMEEIKDHLKQDANDDGSAYKKYENMMEEAKSKEQGRMTRLLNLSVFKESKQDTKKITAETTIHHVYDENSQKPRTYHFTRLLDELCLESTIQELLYRLSRGKKAPRIPLTADARLYTNLIHPYSSIDEIRLCSENTPDEPPLPKKLAVRKLEDTIAEAIKNNHRPLELHILADYLDGTLYDGNHISKLTAFRMSRSDSTPHTDATKAFQVARGKTLLWEIRLDSHSWDDAFHGALEYTLGVWRSKKFTSELNYTSSEDDCWRIIMPNPPEVNLPHLQSLQSNPVMPMAAIISTPTVMPMPSVASVLAALPAPDIPPMQTHLAVNPMDTNLNVELGGTHTQRRRQNLVDTPEHTTVSPLILSVLETAAQTLNVTPEGGLPTKIAETSSHSKPECEAPGMNRENHPELNVNPGSRNAPSAIPKEDPAVSTKIKKKWWPFRVADRIMGKK